MSFGRYSFVIYGPRYLKTSINTFVRFTKIAIYFDRYFTEHNDTRMIKINIFERVRWQGTKGFVRYFEVSLRLTLR